MIRSLRLLGLIGALGLLTELRGVNRYDVTPLSPHGFVQGTAINNLGQVIGTSATGRMLFWDGQAVHDLGTGGGTSIVPLALNDAGVIVGYVNTSEDEAENRPRAFVYKNGEFIDLAALLPASPSAARAINQTGMIAGDFQAGASGGMFRYADGVVTLLEVPIEPNEPSRDRVEVTAINERGEITGRIRYAGSGWHPGPGPTGFIYRAGEIQRVAPFAGDVTTGFGPHPFSTIQGINDAGYAVGLATAPLGDSYRYAAILVSPDRTLQLGSETTSWSPHLSVHLNNRGEVLGSIGPADGNPWTLGRVALWSGGTIHYIDTALGWPASPGVHLWSGGALNDHGQILVSGPTGSGDAVGLILLTPRNASDARLINLSARAAAGENQTTAIAGFALRGGETGRVLLRVIGPTLTSFNVDVSAQNPALRLHGQNGQLLQSNDDWHTPPTADQVSSAAAQVGAFPLGATSADAALLVDLVAGNYTIHAANPSDSTRVVLAEVYDAGDQTHARLMNASIRLGTGDGPRTGIVGFVLEGDYPATLLLRAIGPSLAGLGVTGAHPDPRLSLHRGSTLLMQNQTWGSRQTNPALAATMERIGAFPLLDDSADAALLVTLSPGAYTVHVPSANGSSGVVLVELYVVPLSLP